MNQVAMALAGEIVCNIGQVTKEEKRALDKLVKTGQISKWRGYWYPVSGASWGMGPLKTCWGLDAARYGIVTFRPVSQ